MFIQDSHRSYRSYSYAGLILITDIFLVGTPVGVQNLYLCYGVYTCSKVPVGITKITERVQVLRNLFLYGSTCKYYKTYTGTSYLILVLRSISWSYGTYTGISEHILVFRILYVYYRTYTCLMELILILWILSLCEGTRRYNKSELIIIVSHTGSDQTYADTYQIWTLVHSRYRS